MSNPDLINKIASLLEEQRFVIECLHSKSALVYSKRSNRRAIIGLNLLEREPKGVANAF